VKDSYDAAHDTERKRALSALLSQTKQQERKDAETLAEAKRIMESRAASKPACLRALIMQWFLLMVYLP